MDKGNDAMDKIKMIGNLIGEFGCIDGLRIVYWLVIKKFNLQKIVGVKEIHSKFLGGGVYIRPCSTDLDLLIEFFAKVTCGGENREYDIEFEKNADDVKYILDCGANIGLFSLLYAKRYPSAKIIAVEPEYENYKVLCMNAKRNSNIIVLQNAIWNQDAVLKIIPRDTGAYGFMVQECEDGFGDVEGISINYLMEKYDFPRIDILKMDIEGSELEVITRDSTEWLNKTGILILETHERIKAGSEKKIEKELLVNNDYVEGKSNGENRIFYRVYG